MRRWTAYCLLTISLGAAVLLRGGVDPQQWQWIAVGVSIAALMCVAGKPAPKDRWSSIGFWLLGGLAAWMGFALLPLPPAVVAHLSPDRWSDVIAARQAAGADPNRWMALSYAPASTLERLLDVLPAMAVFVAGSKMAWWWRERAWIAAAPILFVAAGESALGLAQFCLSRLGGEAAPATGTYVNRNHFAGLLELALPLALMWAVSLWRENPEGVNQSMGAALRIAAMLGIAVCVLAAIVVSLSRMGFLAAIASLVLVTALMLLPRAAAGGWRNAWKWTPLLAIPVALLLLLPSSELRQRFAFTMTSSEVSSQTRLEIWRDTLHFVSGHEFMGSGLGTYERGLYRYKTVKPTNTLDFAHNDYLQILAELGIPGVAMFAGLLIWMVRRPLGEAFSRRYGRHRELCIGLLGAFFAIALHSLTDFNLYIPANALAVAWLGGLAISPGLGGSTSCGSKSSGSNLYNASAEEGSYIELPQGATTSL
jgi:O-antigen ligase